MAKRKEDPVPEAAHDKLEVMPLGAGNEVGRSCIFLSFKGKHVLLDCGLHLAHSGLAALPFFDEIDPSTVDLLLVTHFHLDHAASLPYLVFRTNFRGRVFMTHATKAVYRMLLSDFVRVTKASAEGALYTEQEIVDSMDRIEVVDFHQVKEVSGIRFWCYVAGHVLGAAMFVVEIAGVRVLYTGDYTREEDRHLKAAEVPGFSPDLCIIESTFGIQLHEPREVREQRFVDLVSRTVLNGGRVLIPAFVFGRAQELLLILEEHWRLTPELQGIPVLYASPMARKAMVLYSTYTGSMNEHMKEQSSAEDPFDFKFIQSLKGIAEFEDNGPSVVLASPGGLQSGMSRQLFDKWCQDPKNVCLIPGFVVEGTLAKTLLSEPKEVPLLNGNMVPLGMQVHHISFAAHADFRETSTFLDVLAPPNIVLVHGESNEMGRLRSKLTERYKDRSGSQVLAPKNCQSTEFHFKAEKTARAVGRMAHWEPPQLSSSETDDREKDAKGGAGEGKAVGLIEGKLISGVLVEKDFSYQFLSPEDLSTYTQVSTGAVVQRQSVPYQGPFAFVRRRLECMFEELKEVEKAECPSLVVGDRITLAQEAPDRLVLQWVSDPVSDMVADAVIAVLLQVEGAGTATTWQAQSKSNGEDKALKKEDLKSESDERKLVMDLLKSMFGDVEESSIGGLKVVVDHVEALVTLPSGQVECTDIHVKTLIKDAVFRLLTTARPLSLSL